MRTSTAKIKREHDQDIRRIGRRNNTKDARRTQEQIHQSMVDQKSAYLKKWLELKKEAETQTARNYCDHMIGKLNTWMV